MPEWTLDEAIAKARDLKEKSEKAGKTLALQELAKQVSSFEQEGYPLASIIPAGEDAGLSFSLTRANAATFFEIYAKLIRKKMCAEGGEFNKLIQSGLQSSVGAILTLVVTTFGIPAAALGIIIPVAVIIADTGLEAFCEATKEDT